MTYDKFMNTISKSSVDDWIYDDSDGRYIYKNDISYSAKILTSQILSVNN